MKFCGCVGHWRASDELDKLWCVENNIIEEGYVQQDELRGIDAGYKVVQVFADPIEVKIFETGKDRACLERQTSTCQARARLRGFESKLKFLEGGQAGQDRDHRLG